MVTEGGTSSTCTFTLSPNALTPTMAGGTFPIGILTSTGCSWSVSGLPNWITISGPSSGAGPSTIILVVSANSGPPQSAIISIGGIGLPVNQAGTTGPTCVSSLSSGGQAFSAAGGSGTFTVTAPSGCSWTAASTTFWVTTSNAATGNGAVAFQVQANSGPARIATINVSGIVYTVEQGASSISGYVSAGSMPDLTVAGGWSTGITLVNPSASATQVRINFFDDNGNPLTIPLTFPQTPNTAGTLLASSIDRTINPGAVLQIATTGPTSQTTTSGWVQVLSSGSVNGFSAFRFTAGTLDHHTASTAATLGFTIRDGTGATTYASSITVVAMGSSVFVLPTSYGFTANARGTVEIDAPSAGQISILGIEYNTASGGFSTIPALIKQ